MPREDHHCDLLLPDDLYQRIEAWRRSLPVVPSLSATLRALLAKGLDQEDRAGP